MPENLAIKFMSVSQYFKFCFVLFLNFHYFRVKSPCKTNVIYLQWQGKDMVF